MLPGCGCIIVLCCFANAVQFEAVAEEPVNPCAGLYRSHMRKQFYRLISYDPLENPLPDDCNERTSKIQPSTTTQLPSEIFIQSLRRGATDKSQNEILPDPERVQEKGPESLPTVSKPQHGREDFALTMGEEFPDPGRERREPVQNQTTTVEKESLTENKELTTKKSTIANAVNPAKKLHTAEGPESNQTVVGATEKAHSTVGVTEKAQQTVVPGPTKETQAVDGTTERAQQVGVGPTEKVQNTSSLVIDVPTEELKSSGSIGDDFYDDYTDIRDIRKVDGRLTYCPTRMFRNGAKLSYTLLPPI